MSGPAEGQKRKEIAAMKKFLLFIPVFAVVLFARTAGAGAGSVPVRPLKLVLARQSTVNPADVMKNLSEKCPGVILTTNLKASDYMLYAGGWSGGYKFMVIAKGGDTIYATQTVMLSNAVKDVCLFLSKQP
jgi:hypothetical protein